MKLAIYFDYSKYLLPTTNYKPSEVNMISTNGYSVCILFDTQTRDNKFKKINWKVQSLSLSKLHKSAKKMKKLKFIVTLKKSVVR